MDYTVQIFSIILYTLGSILLVASTVLVIMLIQTVKKVNKVVDDIDDKSKKLNGVFDIVDAATDTLSVFSDKVVGLIVNTITNLFSRKNKKEENKDE
jgi:uncharacterized protein YoxC